MTFVPFPRPAGCCCPQGAWFGVVPPYCPVHSPPQPYPTLAPDPVWPAPPPTGLSDADVERIAQRVAELLKAGT